MERCICYGTKQEGRRHHTLRPFCAPLRKRPKLLGSTIRQIEKGGVIVGRIKNGRVFSNPKTPDWSTYIWFENAEPCTSREEFPECQSVTSSSPSA